MEDECFVRRTIGVWARENKRTPSHDQDFSLIPPSLLSSVDVSNLCTHLAIVNNHSKYVVTHHQLVHGCEKGGRVSQTDCANRLLVPSVVHVNVSLPAAGGGLRQIAFPLLFAKRSRVVPAVRSHSKHSVRERALLVAVVLSHKPH